MGKCQINSWKEVLSLDDYFILKDQYKLKEDAEHSFMNNLTNDIYKTKEDLKRLVGFETNELNILINKLNKKYNLNLIV
jgi:hypothetical protein